MDAVSYTHLSTSKNIAVLVKGTSNMLFANIVEEVQKMLEETKSVSYTHLNECSNRKTGIL